MHNTVMVTSVHPAVTAAAPVAGKHIIIRGVSDVKAHKHLFNLQQYFSNSRLPSNSGTSLA
jgi:hypothetical protein